MSDFSDRPLVVGTLTGLRAFAVDKYGRLGGPSYSGVFRPGENEAKCRALAQSLSGLPAGSAVNTSTYSFSLPVVPRKYEVTLNTGEKLPPATVSDLQKLFPPKDDDHTVGGVDCSCGFYAYFDGRNDYHESGQGEVEAIIEGYGVCTVGDRGFRASKAKVVALVTPKHLRPKEAAPEPVAEKKGLVARVFNSPILWGALIAANAVTAALSALEGEWVRAGVSLVWALSIGVQFVLTRKATSAQPVRKTTGQVRVSLTTGPPSLTRDQWDRVVRNYPDVPVYHTRKAALAAHPLTPPEEPTPDDPEFWTRAAK